MAGERVAASTPSPGGKSTTATTTHFGGLVAKFFKSAQALKFKKLGRDKVDWDTFSAW